MRLFLEIVGRMPGVDRDLVEPGPLPAFEPTEVTEVDIDDRKSGDAVAVEDFPHLVIETVEYRDFGIRRPVITGLYQAGARNIFLDAAQHRLCDQRGTLVARDMVDCYR